MGSAKYKTIVPFAAAVIILAAILFKYNKLLPFFMPIVFAHCDTLEGPVVKEARLALDKKDVTPLLKWVKKERETEINSAFAKALSLRAKGKEAKEKADMEFFETLVRVHREGEGAPFTGLKPAGAESEPAVREADKALEAGSVDALVKLITDDAAEGLRRRFNHAIEKMKRKDENVEAGREYVEAYVEFVHYAEKLHLDAAGKSAHH